MSGPCGEASHACTAAREDARLEPLPKGSALMKATVAPPSRKSGPISAADREVSPKPRQATELQSRAVQSPACQRLTNLQRRADQSQVVAQAVGWESLGPLNPRRYLPVDWGGYTPEQMAENGLGGANAGQQAPDLTPTDARTPDVTGPAARGEEPKAVKKKKKKNRRKKRASSAPDMDRDQSDTSDQVEDQALESPLLMPSDQEEEETRSDDEGGWQEVSYSKAPPTLEQAQARQQREQNKQAVAAHWFLGAWVKKADTSGTRCMHGEGSAQAYEYERLGKDAARRGDIESAIDYLEEAIRERQSDPNQSKSPDKGHTQAIQFLNRLIQALERI